MTLALVDHVAGAGSAYVVNTHDVQIDMAASAADLLAIFFAVGGNGTSPVSASVEGLSATVDRSYTVTHSPAYADMILAHYLNPPTPSTTTYRCNFNSVNTNRLSIHAATVSGFDSTTPINDTNINHNTNSSPSVTLAGAVAGDMILICLGYRASVTLSSGPSGATLISSTADGLEFYSLFWYKTASGGDTISCSLSGATNWTLSAVAVAPQTSIQYTQAVAGTLTSSGAIVRLTSKNVAGASTFAGIVSKLTSLTTFVGELIFSGIVSRVTAKSMVGSLNLSGLLEATFVYGVSIGGTLSLAGDIVVRDIYKALSGSITPSGILSKFTTKSFSGALSFTGTVIRSTLKPISGSLSFTGGISRTTLKALAGAVTFIGRLGRQFGAFVTGLARFVVNATGSVFMNKTPKGSSRFDGNPRNDTFD